MKANLGCYVYDAKQQNGELKWNRRKSGKM